jgi:hypothetical protein
MIKKATGRDSREEVLNRIETHQIFEETKALLNNGGGGIRKRAQSKSFESRERSGTVASEKNSAKQQLIERKRTGSEE